MLLSFLPVVLGQGRMLALVTLVPVLLGTARVGKGTLRQQPCPCSTRCACPRDTAGSGMAQIMAWHCHVSFLWHQEGCRHDGYKLTALETEGRG